MKATNILFICKHNKFRSKYAEAMFNKYNKNKDYKAKSAGIIKEISLDSIQKKVGKKLGIIIKGHPHRINSKLMRWADIIVIVADDVLQSLFKKYKKRLIIWKLKDVKTNNEKEIEKTIKIIQKRVRKFINNLK